MGITDGSAGYEEHGGEGEQIGFCRALFGPPTYDPRSCTSGYAIYVDDKCEVFNRDTSSWQKQARSVGYSNQGWTEGRFSDGRTIPSTHNGRENNGPAVTCECFEAPCKYPSPDPECIANGHTSVGNQGFAMDCDAVDGLVDVAVMEITACLAGNGSSSPEPAPELVVVPGSSADLSQVHEQCGGKNWQGPTRCADGSTCTEFNKLYSQCVTREDLSVSFLSRKRLRGAAIKVHRHSA